jgi:hypothetical protein
VQWGSTLSLSLTSCASNRQLNIKQSSSKPKQEMGVSDKLMIELNNTWIMPHNLSWGTESPKTINAT